MFRFPSTSIAKVSPTKTFDGTLHLSLDGDLELELIHCPGESEDHLVVWWPQKKILFCGDNLYRAFPMTSPLSGGSGTRLGDVADSALYTFLIRGPLKVITLALLLLLSETICILKHF